MRRRWSRIAALVSILATVVASTSCSNSGGNDELLIYNAQHESLTKEWPDGYPKETGIRGPYRRGGDTEPGSPPVPGGDASPAGVFLPETPPAMAAVERAGLF